MDQPTWKALPAPPVAVPAVASVTACKVSRALNASKEPLRTRLRNFWVKTPPLKVNSPPVLGSKMKVCWLVPEPKLMPAGEEPPIVRSTTLTSSLNVKGSAAVES